jgi:hypothetical protein
LNPWHNTPDAGIVANHPVSKRNINIEPKKHSFAGDIHLVGKLEISCHGCWPLAKWSNNRFGLAIGSTQNERELQDC